MNLIWAEGAIADLIQIRDYIAEHNPDAAEAMAARLLKMAEILETHPFAGVETARQNVRRLFVAQSAYSLIYRITPEDIEIIEIFDGRRRSPKTDMGP